MKKKPAPSVDILSKSPTGVEGLDDITGGGLPAGRATLIRGAAGCGKTMLALEFLARGATQFGETGVFNMFEENASELAANVRSLGFDLGKLQAEKKIVLDFVHVERSEIEETGEYDLEALFIRLGHAIDSMGAKRVVLDTVEALFAGLPNHAVLRAELRRLFRWLKDRGVTAVITGEKGDGVAITRYGLEEYVADCAIILDQRIREQISTRRLRILKYGGAAHGMNEYPFLIGAHGFSVLPITSLQLDHAVSSKRVPTGIARLDEMLGGEGVYRGSSVLISGSPGTGKSSIAAKFAEAACERGERALYFAYEEYGDPTSFELRLSERIAGLAAGQDLLVKTEWQGVEVVDLVEAQLAHFQELIGTRVRLEGPRVWLAAGPAQGIGMASHELSTNAAKYGALSDQNGGVDIRWRLSEGDDPTFSMSWLERDGPRVRVPRRKGFGQMVIGRMAEAAVDGSAEIDFQESGLSWKLSALAENVLAPSLARNK